MKTKQSVLIVDDDITFCDALARAFSRRSFTTFTAQSAQQACIIAQQHQPDCAVVDLRIGDESGLTVIDQLNTIVPEIRMVILTGYASIATAVEAIKLGAVHYLVKPASADDIISAIFNLKGDATTLPAENPMSVKRLEWEHIQTVLAQHDGNISASARSLGMHRRSLQRKLQKKPVKY